MQSPLKGRWVWQTVFSEGKSINESLFNVASVPWLKVAETIRKFISRNRKTRGKPVLRMDWLSYSMMLWKTFSPLPSGRIYLSVAATWLPWFQELHLDTMTRGKGALVPSSGFHLRCWQFFQKPSETTPISLGRIGSHDPLLEPITGRGDESLFGQVRVLGEGRGWWQFALSALAEWVSIEFPKWTLLRGRRGMDSVQASGSVHCP